MKLLSRNFQNFQIIELSIQTFCSKQNIHWQRVSPSVSFHLLHNCQMIIISPFSTFTKSIWDKSAVILGTSWRTHSEHIVNRIKKSPEKKFPHSLPFPSPKTPNEKQLDHGKCMWSLLITCMEIMTQKLISFQHLPWREVELWITLLKRPLDKVSFTVSFL